MWTLHSRLGGYERLTNEIRATSSSVTWIAPLQGDPDELRRGWKKTRNNLWRSLQKADRAGVTVRESSTDADLRRFYHLYEQNVRHHRSLPHSFRFFAAMRDALGPPGVVRLIVAEHDGDVIAGALLNTFKDRIDLAYVAGSLSRLDVRPNHAVYWHAIRWGIENGYRWYNMGQAPPEGSLAAFKRQWGGEPFDRFRFDYVPGSGSATGAVETLRGVSSRLDAADPSESLPSRAWGRMPLPVIRLAGELVYRWF
jgi:lipid II:glycine glycyltransferase (peptidoglycan interpeptide bridge formation enzyme)